MTRAGRDDGTGESSLEALAQQWLRAVAAHGFVPRKARARVALRELLRQLVAAARAEPFDPAPGRRIGAALVEARMAAPQVLGVSVPLLTERLPALLDADDATVRSRVSGPVRRSELDRRTLAPSDRTLAPRTVVPSDRRFCYRFCANGSCCVRQCSVPNPHTRSTAWMPTTVRDGMRFARILSATRSFGSLNVGITTTSLAM